jgi:hypothetical protein
LSSAASLLGLGGAAQIIADPTERPARAGSRPRAAPARARAAALDGLLERDHRDVELRPIPRAEIQRLRACEQIVELEKDTEARVGRCTSSGVIGLSEEGGRRRLDDVRRRSASPIGVDAQVGLVEQHASLPILAAELHHRAHARDQPPPSRIQVDRGDARAEPAPVVA